MKKNIDLEKYYQETLRFIVDLETMKDSTMMRKRYSLLKKFAPDEVLIEVGIKERPKSE